MQDMFWELLWKVKGLTFYSESYLLKNIPSDFPYHTLPLPIEQLKVLNIRWCVNRYLKQFGVSLDSCEIPLTSDFSTSIADMSDEEFDTFYKKQLKLKQETNNE